MLTNFVGSWLGHRLRDTNDGFVTLLVVNDWFGVTHRLHGGPPFKLDIGDPISPKAAE